MFDRFVLASDYQRIRAKYDMALLPEGEEYHPNYNIAHDDLAYVIKSELTVNTTTFSTSPTNAENRLFPLLLKKNWI